ncbi:hypothetical protein Psal006b_03045 [Piscirickettsia salmonis]|uniref:Peptidase n=1 Tax=Piscirickettsia salmonis TaxID=1238 RepID=A0A1L6TG38_PISSA|nr:hypothetical protein [Piscirickettsia salmonis]AKP74709.2 hypothetical protein PSLF89_3219 [Piscirickettsia salmonis LF-89 = ATCC VR-1361]ALB21366.1 peptidase [Piscirickettsia salmonis]ALY01605.1 hypothetical protein AWE47_00895 [Piscirickettsia salmonis]AMA41117.1 hypothetical protein AWJ11_00890 [Piscirickettsia salmonis]AOS36307.1 hypothetical protein AVM72_13885 [Piscirickettsia salmonis]
MPTIKEIKAGYGEVTTKGEGCILTSSVLLANSIVITAQSSQGSYGLLHITETDKEADSRLNIWLTNLKKAPEDEENIKEDSKNEIIFHIIYSQHNQLEYYQNKLAQLCLNHNINSVIYFFKETKQNQTIIADIDGLDIKEFAPSESAASLTPSTEPPLPKQINSEDTPPRTIPTELSQKSFIEKINLQLQTAISDLEQSNVSYFYKESKEEVIKQLKILQVILTRLTVYPEQPLTQDFLKVIASVVDQYYRQTEVYSLLLISAAENNISITGQLKIAAARNNILEKFKRVLKNNGSKIKQKKHIKIFNSAFAALNKTLIEMGINDLPNDSNGCLIHASPPGELRPPALQLGYGWFLMPPSQGLSTEMSRAGFIKIINQTIESAIDRIKNHNDFLDTSDKKTNIENLKVLQEHLNQLVDGPTQIPTQEPIPILTKEFVQIVATNIRVHYNRCHNKEKKSSTSLTNQFNFADDPKVNQLYLMLEQQLSKKLLQKNWPTLMDDNSELKLIHTLESDIYKSANNQQKLIEMINETLNVTIDQLNTSNSGSLSTADNSEAVTLAILQQSLKKLIESSEQSLTLPFIQSVRRTIAEHQQKITDKASTLTQRLFDELDSNLNNVLLSGDLASDLAEDRQKPTACSSTEDQPLSNQATADAKYSHRSSATLFQQFRQKCQKNRDYMEHFEKIRTQIYTKSMQGLN